MIKFAKELREFVRLLERNGDPTLPFDLQRKIINDFSNKVDRRLMGSLNRTFGQYLEVDHLIEKRFQAYLPQASLDADQWDSKIVPKNAKFARILNGFRLRKPFPYIHLTKTKLLKRLIPHGLEGLFSAQEIWDAHAWAFKELGIDNLDEELLRLKEYFRGAKVKFRIPKRNPALRHKWKQKLNYKLKKPQKTRSPKTPAGKSARGKTKTSSPSRPTVYSGASQTNAKIPEGRNAKGKQKVKSPSKLTVYAYDRGTASSVPTHDERGTHPQNNRRAGNNIQTNVVTVRSGGNDFKIKFSSKYPKTTALMKISGGLLFGMALGSIGSYFREKEKRNAAGIKLAEIFNQESTQAAIESKLNELSKLKNIDSVGYYLHVKIVEVWLGSYDSDKDLISGMEAPFSYAFDSVVGPEESAKKSCKVIGYKRASPGAAEELKYKTQICTYPIIINHRYEIRKAAENINEKWNECVRTEESYKSAGPISAEEQETIENICSKRFGRPIPLKYVE